MYIEEVQTESTHCDVNKCLGAEMRETVPEMSI